VRRELATAYPRKGDVRRESEWCAAYTRHHHEKVVAEHLAGKSLEVFLPLYSSSRRWSDRTKTILLPLFPGYVFFRGAADRRLSILETPGVHMILCSGDHFAHIPEAEIRAVQQLIAGCRPIVPHPFLQCGDRVRIKRGPLQGIEGFLVRKKNECRLVLSVEMLAQSVSIEVDVFDIEPTPAARAVLKPHDGFLPHLSGNNVRRVSPGAA